MRYSSSHMIYVFLIFIACVNQQQGNEKSIVPQTDSSGEEIFHIDPRKFEDNELNLTYFASNISYISLSNKIKLGHILTIKLTKEAIYIVSDASSGGEGNGLETLVRFDKNGQNPVQIGAIGKGPHEYLSCRYFVVDEKHDRIYINGKVNSVLVFNTKGNYIRDFKFEYTGQRYSQMELLGNKYLFMGIKGLGANVEYLWTITDTLGHNVSQKRNIIPSFETHLGPRSGIFKFEDEVSYWVNYSDTIFTISPDLSYHTSYIITPGEHRDTYQNPPFSLDLPIKLLEFYSPHSFMETNHYLVSRYNFKGKFAYVFIEKNTHTTHIAYFEWKRDVKGGIPNNFDGGAVFNPDVYYADDKNEYLAGTVQPFQLKIHVASQEFKNSTPKYPGKKKELEKLANSLNENDNPVLMLVELKH